MAGGTGTDVRGDRLGRSPKSPTSGNRLRAAVSCGRGRRAKGTDTIRAVIHANGSE